MVEYLRQHSTVPFLIVQPENVRNVRMRLTSDQDNGGRGSPTAALATSPPALATVAEADEEDAKLQTDEELDESLLFAAGDLPQAPSMREANTRPRKIAIAYENDATGQMLLAFAARVVLQPQDSVLLVHCTVGKREIETTPQNSAKSLASSLVEGGGSAKGLDNMGKDARDAGCMPRPGGVAGVRARVVLITHSCRHLVCINSVHTQFLLTIVLLTTVFFPLIF